MNIYKNKFTFDMFKNIREINYPLKYRFVHCYIYKNDRLFEYCCNDCTHNITLHVGSADIVFTFFDEIEYIVSFDSVDERNSFVKENMLVERYELITEPLDII